MKEYGKILDGNKKLSRNVPITLFILVILQMFPFVMRAQFFSGNRYTVWPSFAVQKDFGERWSLKLEHSSRVSFSPIMLDESFLQLGTEFVVIKDFSLGLQYRFSEVWTDEKYFMAEHRVSFETDMSTNIKRFGISFRPSAQMVFSGANVRRNLNPEWCIRPEVKLDYNPTKTSLKPFLSVEAFVGRLAQTPFSIYKYRLTLGASHRMTRHLKMSVFIRQMWGSGALRLTSSSIAGIDFTWKL